MFSWSRSFNISMTIFFRMMWTSWRDFRITFSVTGKRQIEPSKWSGKSSSVLLYILFIISKNSSGSFIKLVEIFHLLIWETDNTNLSRLPFVENAVLNLCNVLMQSFFIWFLIQASKWVPVWNMLMPHRLFRHGFLLCNRTKECVDCIFTGSWQYTHLDTLCE